MAARSLRQIPDPPHARPVLVDLSRTVRTADDTADLLRTASRAGSTEFARRMHERACEQGEEDRMAFWREVEDLLAGRGA